MFGQETMRNNATLTTLGCRGMVSVYLAPLVSQPIPQYTFEMGFLGTWWTAWQGSGLHPHQPFGSLGPKHGHFGLDLGDGFMGP